MNRLIPIIVVVLAIVAGGAWYLTQGGDTPTDQTQVTSSGDVDTTTDTSGVIEMVMGDPNAPVELIEYASFTCPHCASFHEAVLKPLKADYVDTGKVKVVFRDVYFDRVGLWASMVARCGGEERFWGMTDLLMKGQKDWAGSGDPATISGELRKVGRLAGLGEEQINACMQDEDKAKALVAWSEKNLKTHDISGTPTMIINGEKHSNMSYSDLKAILDAKIGG
ncbi:DsbA family protein [Shimia sediminis]|uniref:DsbA family protein n=1 Tax=Shimia sediminis TaxID=2497945 RepID=UPI000F8E0EDB|nr:DsbA family protein [Shimia sediminis]